jgi:hypothetical protein
MHGVGQRRGHGLVSGHVRRRRRKLDVGGNLLDVGGLIVIDEVVEGGDFLK